MIEIWKPIKDYEGLYEVSNYGKIKSLPHKWVGFGKNINCKTKQKIRITKVAKTGYEQVVLFKDGTSKTFLVHRLVAEAFLPNPNNYPCINHKDENPSNNCVWNLEWCTFSYNINYGNRKEKVKYKSLNGKLSKKIIQYSLDGDYIAEYPSISEIERVKGFNRGNISNCCNGRQKTAYGSIWKYKEAV